MHILVVKLSSLGDVVHTLPVLADIHRAIPGAQVDWAIEPGFAPLLDRAEGVRRIIRLPLRSWRGRWFSAQARPEMRQVLGELRHDRYDAILDLQGLSKSAIVARLARGRRFAMAHRTEGSSYEPLTRWVADRRVELPWHVHALDRSRLMAASALGYEVAGPPRFGLEALALRAAGAGREARGASTAPCVAFLHGTSRADKLWPEASWSELGRRLVRMGWRIALPHANAEEEARAGRLAQAIGEAALRWPSMRLDAFVDALAGCDAAIGVDAGPSHVAVALGLPHVQIYRFPTAWRTGPQASQGHLHQRSIGGESSDPVAMEGVLAAFEGVWRAAQGSGEMMRTQASVGGLDDSAHVLAGALR